MDAFLRDPKGEKPSTALKRSTQESCRGFQRSPREPQTGGIQVVSLPFLNHLPKATKDSQAEMNQIKQCKLACSSFPMQGQAVLPSTRQRQDWGKGFHLCPPLLHEDPALPKGAQQPSCKCASTLQKWGGVAFSCSEPLGCGELKSHKSTFV